jgi:hypothetical protein
MHASNIQAPVETCLASSSRERLHMPAMYWTMGELSVCVGIWTAA